MPDDVTQRKPDDRTVEKREQTTASSSESTIVRSDATMVRSDATVMRAQKTADEIKKDEKSVPLEWKPGDKILDTYEVIRLLGEGGMGKVFLVLHRGWGIELAVKCPKAELFTDAKSKEEFVTEADTWVKIDPHPNIVSCYYVRTLGNMPRLFAECANAGSLKDWIKQRKVKDQKVLLDIAIQFARGIDFAHKNGLVHQDIKPANVLMMEDGTAKVTDFGLAKAAKGAAVSGGGMTPAYASPEQFSGQSLTAATDVWSWAASVLEMYTGAITWGNGPDALKALEALSAKVKIVSAGDAPTGLSGRGAIPGSIAALLRKCFEQDPAKRPQSMKEIAAELVKIYESELKEPYNREEPELTGLRADGLNNRALSMLDLGKTEEAEKLFAEALVADPHHTEATYNSGLLQWRNAKITDDEFVKRMEEMRTSHTGDWQDEYLLGLVHIERGDRENALKILEEAAKGGGANDTDLKKAFEIARNEKSGGWTRCVGNYPGHTDGVTALCLSHDGRRIISGSRDSTLKLWNIDDGKCVLTFIGHKEGVNSVAVTPDGQYALSGGGTIPWGAKGKLGDEPIRIWDMKTGVCRWNLNGHNGPIDAVRVSPDGRFAVSAGYDNILRRWDIDSGRYTALNTASYKVGDRRTLAISSDGRHIVYGDSNCNLSVWDMATGKNVWEVNAHDWPIASLCVSQDCRCILSGTGTINSGSSDHGLRLWDFKTGAPLQQFTGHVGAVNSVVISPDSRFGISGDKDRMIRVWELATGRCVRTIHEVKDELDKRKEPSDALSIARNLESHKEAGVNSLVFGRGGGVFFSGSSDALIRKWEFGAAKINAASFVVSRVRATAEEGVNARLVKDKKAAAKKALSERRFEDAYREIIAARAIPGYERNPELLGMGFDAGCGGRIKGLRGGWLVRKFRAHERPIECIAVTRDFKRAVSGGLDEEIRVWDLTKGERTLSTGHEYLKYKGSIMGDLTGNFGSLDISSDGCLVLSAFVGGGVVLWDTASGKCTTLQEPGKGKYQPYIKAIALFNPDCKTVLSAYDKRIRVFDLATGGCTSTLKGHKGDIYCMGISLDGRVAASAGSDGDYAGDIRIWDMEKCKCRTAIAKGRCIKLICMSPDGRRAVSTYDVGGGQGTYRIYAWNLVDGKEIFALDGHSAPINELTLSPDGRFCVSGSGQKDTEATPRDNTIRVWDIDNAKCLRVFEGQEQAVSCVRFSHDGRYLLSAGRDGIISIWELEWDYEFPEQKDWDDGAKVYLEIFLSNQKGKPWTDDDFKQFLAELSYRGYGWLKPDGVKRELEKMAANRPAASAKAPKKSGWSLFGK